MIMPDNDECVKNYAYLKECPFINTELGSFVKTTIKSELHVWQESK